MLMQLLHHECIGLLPYAKTSGRRSVKSEPAKRFVLRCETSGLAGVMPRNEIKLLPQDSDRGRHCYLLHKRELEFGVRDRARPNPINDWAVVLGAGVGHYPG